MITWAFAWLLVKLEVGRDYLILLLGLFLQCVVSISELIAIFYIVQELAK